MPYRRTHDSIINLTKYGSLLSRQVLLFFFIPLTIRGGVFLLLPLAPLLGPGGFTTSTTTSPPLLLHY